MTTPRASRSIAAGFAAYRRGELAEARRVLAGLDHPQALHLLGLVEKRAGNPGRAAELLARAASAAPDDPELAHNRGLVARQLGDDAGAEAAYRRALALRPDFVLAAVSLGRLLIDRERWEEAEALYEALLRDAPDSLPVRYGAATVMLARGQARAAAAEFDRLVAAGHAEPAIRFMRARARLELRQVDEALADLRASYAAEPSAGSLTTLAGVLWMRGEREAFEALVTTAATDRALLATAAEALRQCGEPRRALALLQRAEEREALPPAALTVRASAAVDVDDAALAEAAARRALQMRPGDRTTTANLIVALLMQHRADEAMTHIGEMRAAEPLRQHWIAYEATALRLRGDAAYGRLVDLDRFVRPYTLPTPPGFADLDAFNAALLEALDRWQVYSVQPLDQSLRGGTQTPTDLTAIDDPVIRAYVAALDQPIRRYMAHVGAAADHPLTRRNTGEYRIAGCWSVRLGGGGRHVNHVHPEGWISSAYYVAVPPCADAQSRAGWIKFGEPPFRCSPPLAPQKWVRPEAGMLVLFPSYLWHGTEAIGDGLVRVTAPFDVQPR